MKIVFVCLLDQGHFQIPFALGKNLLYRNPNNEIYFVANEENRAKIEGKCSKFKILLFEESAEQKKEFQEGRQRKIETWTVMDNKERFLNGTKSSGRLLSVWRQRQKLITDLINQVEPDLIMVENLFNLPFIMALKYKWAMIVSTSPLKIADHINYPPMGSGVIDDFKWYTDVFIEHGVGFRQKFDEWYQEFNLVRKPSLSPIEASPYLNVCIYPKMLNYFEPHDLPGKWIQLSTTIVKDEVNKFIKEQGWIKEQPASKELLSEEFLKKPGKLILFSIGTLVSDNVEIFKKILPILSECPHKFIVSKGKNGDQFELPSNCVGSNTLNQLELLPLVDLFITHGGNNSFTESCYFGTPMIIIPAFGDQLDNACRLETFDLGKKVTLSDISKEKLCSAIDYVIGNESIKKKMKEISESMKVDNTMDKLCDLIIEICSK